MKGKPTVLGALGYVLTDLPKVDNTSTVAWNDKRNTVRISSNDYFEVGSLWIADMYHVPYGVGLLLHLSLYYVITRRLSSSALFGQHGYSFMNLLLNSGLNISFAGGPKVLIGPLEGEINHIFLFLPLSIYFREIDTFEGVNMVTKNSMTLHTEPGKIIAFGKCCMN